MVPGPPDVNSAPRTFRAHPKCVSPFCLVTFADCSAHFLFIRLRKGGLHTHTHTHTLEVIRTYTHTHTRTRILRYGHSLTLLGQQCLVTTHRTSYVTHVHTVAVPDSSHLDDVIVFIIINRSFWCLLIRRLLFVLSYLFLSQTMLR